MAVLALVERVGGQMKMMKQINEAQACGQLTAKNSYDIKQAVKEACAMGEGLTVKSEAITELDKKISEAIQYYR